MRTPRALALSCVLAASACSGGSGSSGAAGPWTRQEPASSRDVPPPGNEYPGPGRDYPGEACPPCAGSFTCSLASGQSVIAASMGLTSGACALLDSRTDIILLECGGAVAASDGDVGTWQGDGQGGVVVQLATERVACTRD